MYVPWCWVPIILLTIGIMGWMLRPLQSTSDMFGGGFEAMFRLAWLIPLLAAWVLHFLFLRIVGW